MNLVGTHPKRTAYMTISSDIAMSPKSFLAFSVEAELYVWDDHNELGFEYSKENEKLRIMSHTDVSCVLEDVDNSQILAGKELDESTDLVAILQKYMKDDQTVRLVTTFDGPDCFGAAVVKFNRTEILAEVSTNDVED